MKIVPVWGVKVTQSFYIYFSISCLLKRIIAVFTIYYEFFISVETNFYGKILGYVRFRKYLCKKIKI